ncbi:DUF2339 domain-containing protein [Arenimonas aestuarii]
MSWILGFVGALLGALIADESRMFFGFLAGAGLGLLTGGLLRLRRRVGALEQQVLALRGQAASTAAPARPAPMPEADVGAPGLRPEVDAPSPAPQPPPVPAQPEPAAVRPVAATAPAPRIEAPAEPAEPAEPDPVTRALLAAKAWLFEGNVPVKLGVLVLMFGVAAAIKYAADAGWLVVPIELRLAGIAAAAIALLVWGLRSTAERPAFGLSLQGGAIGILLLVVFAAFRNYHVLSAMPAFVLVVILVAGASVLAVKQDAPALAVLGFIGGYLAPVLLSTGSGNHVALFSYYAVLNAAVFAIAWKKPWRALNLVGFVFTFAIGGIWGAKYYRPELFATVEPFLVLFFLFYIAIPVLYALAGRQKNGKVDGTLLFGTPLLAFPMQVGLLEGDRFGLATSAVVVAAIFAGLALWATRNARLRDLAQSAAGMGVVFATLAIPLALDARWTSAAWALQGLGMVWLGLRQGRRLTRWSGLVLLVLASGAWFISLFEWNLEWEDRFVINGHAMNLGLLALGWLGASFFYMRAGASRVLQIVLFLVGLGFWVVLGVREIEVNLSPRFDALYYAGFCLLTAALAAALRKPMVWPRLSWPVAASVMLLLPLSLVSQDHWDTTMFDWPLLLWWPLLAGALVTLRALRTPRSLGLVFAHLAWLGTVALAGGITLMRVLHDRAGLADGWLLPAVLAPLAVLFVLTWKRPDIGAWPVAGEFPRWRTAWLAIAGFGLAMGWLFGHFLPGDARPLVWLPVLNPLELFLLLGLAVAAQFLRSLSNPHRLGWLAWAGAALFTLSMGVLRACHQLADLPWSPVLLGETLAQASLTVAWCLAGVTVWILGSRRGDRALWWLGAGLLGVVLLKLLVVDRQFVGNIAGIVSFVVVGLLLIVVGRIAPTPPRRSE